MYSSFFTILLSKLYTRLQKKTGNKNFPNVNLVFSICQLIIYFTIAIK
jgi:hypothetical protein